MDAIMLLVSPIFKSPGSLFKIVSVHMQLKPFFRVIVITFQKQQCVQSRPILSEMSVSSAGLNTQADLLPYSHEDLEKQRHLARMRLIISQ